MAQISDEQLLEVRKLIGSWLQQLREAKGLTETQLAEQMGVHQSTINKIENGKWNFTVDYITKFAYHLDFYQFFIPKDSNDELAVMMRDRWKRANESQ